MSLYVTDNGLVKWGQLSEDLLIPCPSRNENGRCGCECRMCMGVYAHEPEHQHCPLKHWEELPFLSGTNYLIAERLWQAYLKDGGEPNFM